METVKVTNEEVLDKVDNALAQIRSIIAERGKEYGPDMLMIMGPAYPLVLVVAKALRLWYHMNTNLGEVKWDTLLDLSAYAVLAMVMVRWQREEK